MTVETKLYSFLFFVVVGVFILAVILSLSGCYSVHSRTEPQVLQQLCDDWCDPAAGYVLTADVLAPGEQGLACVCREELDI